MDKLHAMNVFVHIVDKGSLTQAAEALSSSLPTVVRTLANLEQSLGVRLLNRTTRKISLTMEGQQYLQNCRNILRDVKEMEEQVTQQEEPKGTITISAPSMFGQLHVAPIINQFLARYPQVQAKLLFLDRVIDLVEEGVDLSVRIGRLSDSSLIAIPVGFIHYVVCASSSYTQAQGIPTHPNQLQQYNCICISALEDSMRWRFRGSKDEALRVQVSGSLICNQAATGIDACLAGLGFGMFLSYQVLPYIQQERLVRVLQDFERDPIPVHIVYPHAKYLSSRVRSCLDWLREDLRVELQTLSETGLGPVTG